MLANLVRWILSRANAKHRTGDAKTLTRTVLAAIAPSVMPEKKTVAKLGRLLGYKTHKSFRRKFERAVAAKAAMLTDNNAKLLQPYEFKKKTKFDEAFIRRLHHYLLYECDLVVDSPNAKDSVTVKDPHTGEKTVTQRKYRVTNLREVYNKTIVENPEWAGTFEHPTIGYTAFCYLLPAQIRKLTDSQKSTCGCDVCIMAKEYLDTLNAWESHQLNRMKARVERETNRRRKAALKGKATRFEKEIAPPAGSTKVHRWEHPREVVSQMTCQPVTVQRPAQGNGPTSSDTITKLHCCIGDCEQCPDLPLPKLETSTTQDTILFQTYVYHSYCSVHKSLEGAPEVCPFCENIRKKKLKEETGTVYRKAQLHQKRSTISQFITKHFIPQMKKYRYHMVKVAMLGKHHCKHWRSEGYKTMGAALYADRDYADGLVPEYTEEFMSTHFGNHVKLSMETNPVHFLDSVGNELLDYHCYISEDKRQDARTTYMNQSSLLREFNAEGGYPEFPHTNVDHLFENTDGCAKQYRSVTAMQLMAALAVKYEITFNRMVGAPHHGKGIGDAFGGMDKNRSRNFYRQLIKPEIDDESKPYATFAHTIEADGKMRDAATYTCSFLQHPDFMYGAKCAGGKYTRRREAHQKLNRRCYHAVHHGNTDTAADPDFKLVLEKSKWVAVGFDTSMKQSGIQNMHNFYACKELGPNSVAVRRIACFCLACKNQLVTKWDNKLPAKDQARFKRPEECLYKTVFGDYNDWRIIEIRPPAPKKDKVTGAVTAASEANQSLAMEEMEELKLDILAGAEAAAARNIFADSYGAYDRSGDFDLIQFTSEPYPLQDETVDVEGCPNKLPLGELVCNGRYLSKVGGAARWYTRKTGNPPQEPQEYVFRVRYVVSTNVIVRQESISVKLPNKRTTWKEEVRSKDPRNLSEAEFDRIQGEIARRAMLDFEENCEPVQQGEAVVVDESEDEEEDNDL